MASFLVYSKERLLHAMMNGGSHSSSTEKRQRRDEPVTVDDLALRLRRNEITELKVGWRNSDFLRSRRSVTVIEKALKQNTSVTAVTIGWRRHTSRDCLVKLLTTIGRHCVNLKHLKLVLDDWIPEHTLNDILRNQQDLVTIDIQAVQVLTKNFQTGKWCCNEFASDKTPQQKQAVAQWPPPVHYAENDYSDKSTSTCGDHHSVVSRCIIKQLGGHQNLKVLSLVECALDDTSVCKLADWLHIRGGVSELSLRSNRKLTGHGLRIICQAPVMRKLDLSLCDLECSDAYAVAEGIAARPWPVHELLLAGNYRMGSMGLLALTLQKCCQKLVSLDMSYCDSKDYRAVMVLNALAQLAPNTTLKCIKLHGSFVGNNVVAAVLQRLLATSNSLRSIQLNDPQDPKPMNATQLCMVLAGVEQNYELEELKIDSMHSTEELRIWNQINFLLRLNIAGRRVLRSNQPSREYSGFPVTPADDWFQVLEKAGEDDNLTVLYWIVRQSADHFDHIGSATMKKEL